MIEARRCVMSDDGELWDRDDIAEFLGVKPTSVNAWLSRHGVKPVGAAVVGKGSVKNLYDPAAVWAAKAAAPGVGPRSDLQ